VLGYRGSGAEVGLYGSGFRSGFRPWDEAEAASDLGGLIGLGRKNILKRSGNALKRSGNHFVLNESGIFGTPRVHAVQKLFGPVPEHGMDLSGAGHTRVFCKARVKRVKKLQQLYHELLRVCPGYILSEKDTG
jgi:hypothetical protein